MFNFGGDLSQLPSHHLLLISFTYVTKITSVHLSFCVVDEKTGIYTTVNHPVPMIGSCLHNQTFEGNKVCITLVDIYA